MDSQEREDGGLVQEGRGKAVEVERAFIEAGLGERSVQVVTGKTQERLRQDREPKEV